MSAFKSAVEDIVKDVVTEDKKAFVRAERTRPETTWSVGFNRDEQVVVVTTTQVMGPEMASVLADTYEKMFDNTDVADEYTTVIRQLREAVQKCRGEAS